jgi:hypothetical protein
MPTVMDTAYPRLKDHPTPKELEECYTPTVPIKMSSPHLINHFDKVK